MNVRAANPFNQLHALGYDRLLCVIPPGQPVREAGKRPGQKGPSGWYGVSVKTFSEITPEDLSQWNAWGGGAGIRCDGKFIAIDIDSTSSEWSGKIRRTALDVLGPAPVRVGRAPKCLLVYRATDAIEYRNIRFDDGVSPDKPGLVECLSGAGGTKWFVAHGIHNVTGQPYRWPDGIPHADELTTVSETQIAEFFERLGEHLPKAKGAGSTTADREKIDQDALKGDLRDVEAATHALKNDRSVFGYEEWVRVAAALRGACQDDPQFGLDLFCEFSEKADLTEQTEDPVRVYNSITPPFGLGADYLYTLAEKHGDGSFTLASKWFEDLGEPPEPSAFEIASARENQDRAQHNTITATPYGFPDPTEIQPRQWIYGQHYIRKFVSATVAPSGVGKSSLEIVEALVMASGKPLLGVEPKGQFRVWLWNGEDPRDELERRIAAAMLHYGLTRQDIGDRLFVDTGRETEIVLATETRNGVLISQPVADAVLRQIRLNTIDVLQIDPFVSSHRVSENDNGAIDLVTKQWAKLADAGNCSIELVHHVRKLNGAEITVEDSRGATALLATSRSARAIARMSKGEAQRFGLGENAHRRLFRFGDGKNNLALPASDATEWFELRSVGLGNGAGAGIEGLMNGDHVGVVTRYTVPEGAALGVMGDGKETALALVRGGEWRRDIRAGEAWIGVAIAQAMKLDAQDAEDKARINAIISAWIKDGTLVEVTKKDAKRRQKTFVEAAEYRDTVSQNIFD